MTKTLHLTTPHDTIIPILYIDAYSDPKVKALIHEYKFSKPNIYNISTREELTRILTDICIEIITAKLYTDSANVLIFSCPPSTMYARREKSIDSMWNLLSRVGTCVYWYTQHLLKTSVLYIRIFAVKGIFIKNRRAQHIGGSRKSRITDTQNRYSIRLIYKVYLYFLITFRHKRNFSFYIIDDVSSTGGTLLASKETLETYMQRLQQKRPEISFDIQVFSLVH